MQPTSIQMQSEPYDVYERADCPWKILVQHDGNEDQYVADFRLDWEGTAIFTLLPGHATQGETPLLRICLAAHADTAEGRALPAAISTQSRLFSLGSDFQRPHDDLGSGGSGRPPCGDSRYGQRTQFSRPAGPGVAAPGPGGCGIIVVVGILIVVGCFKAANDNQDAQHLDFHPTSERRMHPRDFVWE